MPPYSKSNTGPGATGAHTEKDLDVTFDHVLWIFLFVFFDETIFSNTTGSDLSNGVGLVSVYAVGRPSSGS